MRLTTVILIASLMQVSASTFGQRVTLNKANASLFSVLKDIRKQTGYGFYYDPATISQNQKVSISVANATVEEALSSALKGLNLVYEIDGKIVTIKIKEKPSFLERVVASLAEINVSGRVVDADGRGLPGASVSVKGKSKAVSTGANGSFYLKGVDEDATLIISFIGYVPKEMKAAKDLGDVVLELSNSKLDEVQVIAYGTTTQRLSTGNVTTIRANVIEKQPVNNPLLALQGRVPGLFIEQATGFAGTGVKVRIQGQNSLNYGSDPLYVIDGVPFVSQLLKGGNQILGNSGSDANSLLVSGNPLNFINPSDIESIDVLKDADATSIYGSRAANGAILITTKKGKYGDSRVSLNLQSGFAKVPHKLDLMNSEQYLEMRREALKNDGILNPQANPYGDSDLNGHWDNSRYTDWQEELLGKTAQYQDINASISGGSENTTFLINSGYHRETNVFPGDFSDQKASLHFNVNNLSLNKRLHLQFSGGYLFDYNNTPTVDLTKEALTLAPVAPPLFNSDGSINWAIDELGATSFLNRMGYLKNSFLTKTNNLIGNMVISYNIVPGLELKSSFGYNNLRNDILNKSRLDGLYPESLPYGVRTTVFSNANQNSWNIEPQLTFKRAVSHGTLEVLLGVTILQQKSNGSSLTGVGFSNDLVMEDVMSASSINRDYSTSSATKNSALFGRINYNWKDKYILNLTGRRDGSSRFGPENRFHNFGALGAAWIFSNEKLLKNNLAFLSFGKIKGSYGTTGSDQIGDYLTLSLYNVQSQDHPYQGIPIYRPNGLTNPYLQWEQTKKLSFGLDLGFFNDRISLSTNYYRNHSSNQLGNYVLPITAGSGSIIRNQPYKIRNYGWELALSSVNIENGPFKWSSVLNITIPKTLLVDYPELYKSSMASYAIVGRPLTAHFAYHYLGVDPARGVYVFADKNGNPTSTPGTEDKTVIIDLAPKFYGGYQNSFSYGDFQLDVLFSFVRQMAQNYSFGSRDIIAGRSSFGIGNQPASLMSRWQKPGDVSDIQRFTTSSDLKEQLNFVYESDAGYADASYIRLKNISFLWKVPSTWLKKIRLNNCSLFVQAQNVFTITGYSGLDPETRSSTSLPPLRVISFGLKAGL